MSRSSKPRSGVSPNDHERTSRRRSAFTAFQQRNPGEDDTADDDDRTLRRYELVRHILTILGLPQRCHEGACRRSGRCVGLTLRCQRDFPAPKISPEQERANLAKIYKLVRERAEALDAAEPEPSLNVPAPARRPPAPASRDKARRRLPSGSRPSGRR